MALRDQPYLPLYVQDFMTDEKLMECSASTTGVYIRLMCVLHKSEQYGTILLKQKFKQTDKQTNNFALQIAKFLPYDFDCIHVAICELIDEKVLIIEGDNLIQKRMVKDSILSEKRAQAGKKGGEETQKVKPIRQKIFAKAKHKANTENEYVIENVINYLNKKVSSEFKTDTKSTVSLINSRIKSGYKEDDFKKVIDIKTDKWLMDIEMNQYLRPSTLFGEKFESYLNEKPVLKIQIEQKEVYTEAPKRNQR